MEIVMTLSHGTYITTILLSQCFDARYTSFQVKSGHCFQAKSQIRMVCIAKALIKIKDPSNVKQKKVLIKFTWSKKFLEGFSFT